MSMDATATSPLLEAAEGVRSGRVSSEELVIQALKRLEETEGDVGAFLSVQGRAAVEAAKAIDRQVGNALAAVLAADDQEADVAKFCWLLVANGHDQTTTGFFEDTARQTLVSLKAGRRRCCWERREAHQPSSFLLIGYMAWVVQFSEERMTATVARMPYVSIDRDTDDRKTKRCYLFTMKIAAVHACHAAWLAADSSVVNEVKRNSPVAFRTLRRKVAVSRAAQYG